MKEVKEKIKPPKFNLIKALNEKAKEEKLKFEGAIIAFTTQEGQTGTWTICEDLGVRLRLMQECKIQEKIMELQVEDMARKTTIIPGPIKQDEKREASYLG